MYIPNCAQIYFKGLNMLCKYLQGKLKTKTILKTNYVHKGVIFLYIRILIKG